MSNNAKIVAVLTAAFAASAYAVGRVIRDASRKFHEGNGAPQEKPQDKKQNRKPQGPKKKK